LQANRSTGFREDELFHLLALAGCRVLVPDLRGTGDVTPEYARGAARHATSYSGEDSWAWASLALGRPLLWQRATDVLAAVQALTGDVVLAATGKMTVPALFAASFEPRVKVSYLNGGLASFLRVIQSETYSAAFANFVPGMVGNDLPQVARTIAPRKLILAGTLDGTGTKMPVAEVRNLYPDASVEVEPDPAWTAERLSRL
jgi:pimeloyl-ACP methyl ester carboxylesterase